MSINLIKIAFIYLNNKKKNENLVLIRSLHIVTYIISKKVNQADGSAASFDIMVKIVGSYSNQATN